MQRTAWQQLQVVGMQPTVQCVGKNWKPEGSTAKKHAMPGVHGGSCARECLYTCFM